MATARATRGLECFGEDALNLWDSNQNKINGNLSVVVTMMEHCCWIHVAPAGAERMKESDLSTTAG